MTVHSRRKITMVSNFVNGGARHHLAGTVASVIEPLRAAARPGTGVEFSK